MVAIRCDGGAGFGQGLFINKLLGHWGNRKSFERGALISMVSFAIQGLCFLAGPLNRTVPHGWRANLLCGPILHKQQLFGLLTLQRERTTFGREGKMGLEK